MNKNSQSNTKNQINNTAQATIYLLRHGELEQSGILCGHSDIVLSKKGWRQLEQATKHFNDVNTEIEIGQCYSSPLLRCEQFAQQFVKSRNIPLIIDQQLKEMNFGDWDGKSYERLWQQTSNTTHSDTTHSDTKTNNIGQFWKNPWENPNPNGETMEDFCQRIDDFWQALLVKEQSQKNNKSTLVISHGGVIKHILARIFNMPIPGNVHFNTFTIPYASLIRVNVHYDNNGKIWPSVQF